MAGIDKIYGTKVQFEELKQWLKNNKPEYIKYLYWIGWEKAVEKQKYPISNFPEEADYWLFFHCPLVWVRKRILEQYGLDQCVFVKEDEE
jgi:hypothetical protein